MCYMLYGTINKEVNAEAYKQAINKSDFTFKLGTKHDIKMSIVNCDGEYRVTNWVCDCDSPIGCQNPENEELNDFVSLINDLKNVRDAKYIYLSKTWWGKRNKKEVSVHIDDIVLPHFLANLEHNCLYRIDLYDKYE